jgi:HlyD family secretion protein
MRTWTVPFRCSPGVLAAAGIVVMTFAACRQPSAASIGDTAKPAPSGIAGIGRIEPGDGVVRLATRSLGGQTSIVGQLLVAEGARVRKGQVVAELDSKTQLSAAAGEAAAAVVAARARLAQAKAGAKPSDIAAQQAEVERVQHDLADARGDLRRHEALGANVSAAELDRLRYRVEAAARVLAAAGQRLTSLTAVRPVDVAVAEADVERATRSEARARAEYEASIVRSPIDGRVVRIHAHAGEAVGSDGLMELAPVDPMYAVAEIAESEIPRVKPGQRASVSGEGLSTPLEGTVERIGIDVRRNQDRPVDPTNFSDTRVVDVWVRLDSPKAVEERIHLRVDVIIRP